MQLAVNTQFPKELGGLGAKVLYIGEPGNAVQCCAPACSVGEPACSDGGPACSIVEPGKAVQSCVPACSGALLGGRVSNVVQRCAPACSCALRGGKVSSWWHSCNAGIIVLCVGLQTQKAPL